MSLSSACSDSVGPPGRNWPRIIVVGVTAFVVLVAALGLGAFIWRVARQRAVVQRITALDGKVHYDFYGTFGDDVFDFLDPSEKPPVPSGPRYLLWLLSPDAAGTVDRVLLGPNLGDADLGLLAELPNLQGVILSGSGITDDGMAVVSELPRLERLALFETNVTAAGVRRLRRAPELRGLGLYGQFITDATLEGTGDLPRVSGVVLRDTNVTSQGIRHLRKDPLQQGLTILTILSCPAVGDDAVEHLVELRNVKHLILSDTGISDEGLDRFRAARPDCAIHDGWFASRHMGW
ncbi:MAG: hypothetical protein WD066_11130 [Planctomycetaceae bacterium]